jgi:hypothetical protein
VRCARAGVERRGGGLCAGPAYVVTPCLKNIPKQNPQIIIAPPPKKTRARPSRGIRAHTASTHPELVEPPHPGALAAGMPIGATHVAAVPGTPAACVEPLACDLQLAFVDVSAAHRESASSHPGRAYFGLPRRTCYCALQTAALPSAAARGTSAPRLPPRGFRSDIDPPSRPAPVSPRFAALLGSESPGNVDGNGGESKGIGHTSEVHRPQFSQRAAARAHPQAGPDHSPPTPTGWNKLTG